ncbi:hypothetical protein LTR66_017434, partial [Elasticomyces elasticus]
MAGDLASIRTKLKHFENELTDGLLASRTKIKTLKVMCGMFERLLKQRSSNDDTAARLAELDLEAKERIGELNTLILLFESLQTKLASCARIASSFLQLADGQALQQLQRSSEAETKSMSKLTLKGQRDGAAVKALSVITLIYLPITSVL